MDAARLKRTIEQLVADQRDDLRLRDHLAGLERDEALNGLTWSWGPLLYERNRVTFRSFILNHFSDWDRSGRHWKPIAWTEHAQRLEQWLAAARKYRDTMLVRRLLSWKYADKRWGIDEKAYNAALREAYRNASTAAARAIVLDEFDNWFRLAEETAVSLYQRDRASGDFILRHLPSSFWDDQKRTLWTQLYGLAEKAGDDKLQFTLYRKQKPEKEWSAEVLALAAEVREPDRLNDELIRRHPEGYGLKTSDTLVKLLELRGPDVFPYIRAKLAEAFGGWYSGKPDKLIDLAAARGWWDLWAAAIRASSQDKLFNKAVAQLLDDAKIKESDRLQRLTALAGVTREWNWPGVGFARVHALDDKLAAHFYERYPQMLRTTFRAHVTPTWWQGFPRLLAAAQKANDEDLVDLMASRYATQVRYDQGWYGKQNAPLVETANQLGEYYQGIRDRDPPAFARRASNVLTRMPAFTIHSYDQLLRSNQLARLLFVRSFDAYLTSAEAVRDLVEGSEIHVQMLAYRLLGQNDARARRMAADNLEIVIGTLVRPLQRKTRLAAFDALANAAREDAAAGRLILARARQALRLPDKKYPKEQLIGLIGRVLAARGELRAADEQPRVYGLAEALA